jgi:predicted RNA-binding protein YlxR (DUF448 family)
MLRTCIGCRAVTPAAELVRLVLGPEGDVAIDVPGGSFGRGAWVHPKPSCLAHAPAGLSRALKANVRSTQTELLAGLKGAAARRIQGLILAARRKRALESGASAVELAVQSRRALLVLVATDARDARDHGWLAPLVATGSALAWGEKALFGAWLSRPDTALLAITERGLAQEIRKMIDWTMLPEPSVPSKKAQRTVSSEAG